MFQSVFTCSKLTIKTPEQPQWNHSGIFFVNFEQIAHIVLVVSIVGFEVLYFADLKTTFDILIDSSLVKMIQLYIKVIQEKWQKVT